jgi:hypothetical protein
MKSIPSSIKKHILIVTILFMTTANPYEADYNAKKTAYEKLKLAVTAASWATATQEQKNMILQNKAALQKAESDFLATKKNYESWGVNPTQEVINQTNTQSGWTQQVTTTKPSSVTEIKSTTPEVAEKFTAPNGKVYTIMSNWTSAWFDGWFGRKNHASVDAAKAEINAQNPTTSTPSAWTASWQSTSALWTAVDTAKVEANTNMVVDTNAWNELALKIPNVEVGKALTTNLENINTAFKNATGHLQAAKNLQTEVETLYGENQISAQAESMIKKWLDPAKASQAALFLNLKWRANLEGKVKTLQAEQEKVIANLEMQKAQMLVNAQNADTENQKWLFDQAQNIETQIQWVKNNYQQAVSSLTTTQITPLVNINSANLEAEAATAAQTIQASYDTSTSDRKIAALYRTLGESFKYIDNSIYNFITLPFNELLLKAIEMVRVNTVKEAKALK